MSALNNTKKNGVYDCSFCENKKRMNRQQFIKHMKTEEHKNRKKFLCNSKNARIRTENIGKMMNRYNKKNRNDIRDNLNVVDNVLIYDNSKHMNIGSEEITLTTGNKEKEFEENIFKCHMRVIRRMKKLISKNEELNKYRDNKAILLNLSHRGGWGEELYSNEKEMNACLLALILCNLKRVGTIVSQDRTIEYFELYIGICREYELCYTILKNSWNMYVMVIYKEGIIEENEIIELCNETMDYDRMGYFYGYNDMEF